MSLQSLVALAALVTLAAAQALTVNTPTSVQACLPVALSWTGGVQPVYVSLIPGGQPGGAIVKDFGVQNGNTLTWKVDQPAGTSLSVQIRDSSGALNYSDKFEVQPSTAPCSPDSTPTKSGSATPPASTSAGSTPAGSASKNGTSSPTNSSATTPSSGSTPSTGSTPSSGSTTPTSSSPTASGSTAPAAGASSDASRTIPAIFVVVLSAAAAVFA